jgi:hypothetical protein
MATMGYEINLCDECQQRADYAEFLMSRPDRTVQEVSEYVDPPECKESPRCKWKEKWMESSLGKVEENGQLNTSIPGPDGREEVDMLPEGWMPEEELWTDLWIDQDEISNMVSGNGTTRKQLMLDLKLKHEKLTTKLLESLILGDNVSKGLNLLEELEEIIFSLEHWIKKEEIYGAGDETASDQTQEKGKEKQESPTMMNGGMVTTCPMDGGAGDETASGQTQEKGKEKQESPTMMNGGMVTTCPMDGGADDELASGRTQEKGKEKQ